MDIELTKSEIDSLSQAMKKPEFINLLKDYVDEISDPKNKAEHEAYLKQLEDSGELPQGRKLLRPGPHSCIKTAVTSKRKMKVFINLCQAAELIQPTLERKDQGGNWQVPYAMGQPRHDQDKKGLNCLTLDCAFHPMAFQISTGSSKFMKLLCDTAVEAANKVLESQGEKVSQDYKLMKNLKCKGNTPGSIMVSEYRLKNPTDTAPTKEKTYKLSEEGPKLYKELISTQMKQKQKDNLEKTEEPEVPEKEERQEEIINEKGIALPKHKVVYSSSVDLGEFIDSRYKSYKRPKDAVVTIQVPRLVFSN
jgi:dynein assembly factor 2, axonemal